MTLDFNNTASCFVHTSNWGYTHFYNLCSVTDQIIPWGNLDTAAAYAGVGVLTFLGIMIVGGVYATIIKAY